MIPWVLLGAAFGAVAAWSAYAGLVQEWHGLDRKSVFQAMPTGFWRRSAIIAVVGAGLGAIAMWKVHAG